VERESFNGEFAYQKLVGCSKTSELLGELWFKVRCKWKHQIRKIVLGAEEGYDSADVNTAKQSNLIKHFWVMGIVE
jgi:hypothetical protein